MYMKHMSELFEKEEQVRKRAEKVLLSLDESIPAEFKKEFALLTSEYAQLLRQLRRLIRLSDLTTQGLNADREILLTKVNEDALTEIYNRHFLMTNLEDILEHLRENGEWISIMMLDVDYFKLFNDTYGHLAGDVCLRRVADAICKILSGKSGFAVRYGGEEFIVVLPGMNRACGENVAKDILEGIQKMNILHETSPIAQHITISIGFVSAIPLRGIDMQSYIDRADAAMYLSKKSGRNRITFLPLEEETHA
ncbi:MAG: GGDEF domain-containing protein [Candidatus Pelethousia sp.]|nr:GGDEF domain-containing protein [Candidatus Pelethousia sp.]